VKIIIQLLHPCIIALVYFSYTADMYSLIDTIQPHRHSHLIPYAQPGAKKARETGYDEQSIDELNIRRVVEEWGGPPENAGLWGFALCYPKMESEGTPLKCMH
jgi:hypothetical protein